MFSYLRMGLLTAVVGLVAACGGMAGDTNSSAPDGPSTAPAATSTAKTTAAATPAPGTGTNVSDPCGGSLENCYRYNQMQDFLDRVTPMVEDFFASAYPKYPTPRGIVYIARGQRVASACGGYSDSMAYEFCSADDRIYVGQDLLWQFYRGAGDVAPVVGLAHEWGHHLQALLREPAPRSAAQSVAYEDQADCIAGAWAQYADKQGWLEEQDDLQDVTKLMQAIGSNETRARDHGTVAERTNAFNTGFEQGLKGCSL